MVANIVNIDLGIGITAKIGHQVAPQHRWHHNTGLKSIDKPLVHAGNIPMFPRNLADGLFSLHMGQPTAAMSVHITIQSDGSLNDFGLVASTVNPSRKLTYVELDELLDETMPEQEPTLWALHEVCPSQPP